MDLGSGQVALAQVDGREAAGHSGVEAELHATRTGQGQQAGEGQYQRRFVSRDDVHPP